MVPVLVAHSVLGAHLQFYQTHDGYDTWLTESFRKCVLRVSQKEFDKISAIEHVYLGHENKTMGGIKSCAVVAPRVENPNVLKFAKMWSPKVVQPQIV